ncbi:MAG: hypothetical protein WB814_08890, partial [Candidatus Sulfotelmatobacter sp.]
GWEEVAARSIGTLWSECQTGAGAVVNQLWLLGDPSLALKSGWSFSISTTQLEVNPHQVGEFPHAVEAHGHRP